MSDHEPELRELSSRERKTRDKWLSFKKRLRTNKSLAPDIADAKYRAAAAKFDATMEKLEARRVRLTGTAGEPSPRPSPL